MADNCRVVGTGTIHGVQQFPDELGVRELLEVQRLVVVVAGSLLRGHGGADSLALRHPELCEYVDDVLTLSEMEGASLPVTPNAATEQPRCRSEVLDLELLGEVGLESRDERSLASDDDAVVDVDTEHVEMPILHGGVDARVDLALLESVVNQPIRHALIPAPRGLLRAIERPLQAARRPLAAVGAEPRVWWNPRRPWKPR